MTDEKTISDLILENMRGDSPKKLEEFFNYAKRWGCNVMLKQADVILQGDVDYGKGDAHGDMWDYVPQSMSETHLQFDRDSVHGLL